MLSTSPRGTVPPPLPKAPNIATVAIVGKVTRRHQTPGGEQRSVGQQRWCARSPDRPPPGGLRGLRRVIRRRAENSEASAGSVGAHGAPIVPLQGD